MISPPPIPPNFGPAPVRDTTYEVTHSADCWRWHHACLIARAERLAAALREVLAQFHTAANQPGGVRFAALVPAGLVAEWHQALGPEAPPPAAVRPEPAADTTPTAMTDEKEGTA